MIRKPISVTRQRVLRVASMIVVVAAYSWLAHRQHAINPNDTSIPTWSQMWEGFVRAVSVHPSEGVRWLVKDSVATAERLGLGLLVGVAGGFLLGLAMGCFRSVEAFVAPPLAAFAQLPPTAMFAVYFVLFGVGMQMFVAMIALGVLIPLAQVVYLGVRDVPDEEIWKAYTLGASHGEVVGHVIVRQIAPRVVDALRVQIGSAMVYLIAAEMLVADRGFGYRIRIQSKLVHMDVVYPYLALLGVFGAVMWYGLLAFRGRMFPWYRKGGDS
jgi:NitT/TauT family transport system permease protein